MKWYSYIICFVLIIGGIFCSINMFDIWSQSSNIVGSPTTIETQNDYALLCKFDFVSVAFETENYEDYISQSSYNHYDFNGKDGNYALLLNDNLVDDVVFSSGEIYAQTNINFYGTNGELVSSATLNIGIVFYTDTTQVTISTTNVNDSYAYLTRFITNNGFMLKVVERGL